MSDRPSREFTAVDQALWKRAKEARPLVGDSMRMGGRILRRKREAGGGRLPEGAKDTGSSTLRARREGLWSRSLS